MEKDENLKDFLKRISQNTNHWRFYYVSSRGRLWLWNTLEEKCVGRACHEECPRGLCSDWGKLGGFTTLSAQTFRKAILDWSKPFNSRKTFFLV